MRSTLGLIAGNGRFPFLVLEAAQALGYEVVVIAIKEETFPELEQQARILHWLSLGQLGKLMRILKDAGVKQAIMAGQVKHKQIFSSIVPDVQMMKLMARLAMRNTDSLIGAVADLMASEGITLLNSTQFLAPIMAAPGCMTSRAPNSDEIADITYGLTAAREIARLDIGQTVVVKDRAIIAVEAMEGTDAAIRRAACLCMRPGMSVVKVSKPRQDMRFDVPVIGLQTMAAMRECGATALSVDAGKTLLLDKDQLLETANEAGVAIVGQEIELCSE
jgi:UDP-2,3-diacylglucosamine hydrolase